MMTRQLNVKFLVCLLVPILLLGACVHVLHGFQLKHSALALLKLASRAEETGDSVQAEKYLGMYLSYRPADTAAMARYGLALVKLAKTREARLKALLILEQVLRRDPKRDDVRRKLVDFEMRPDMRRFSDAEQHLKVLLASSPESGELAYLQAQCAEAQGDLTDREPDANNSESGRSSKFDRAVNLYNLAIALKPSQIDSYVRCARLLRTQPNRADEADRIMDAREVKNGLIAANGGSFRAYLERARYRIEYKIDGAEEDVAHALELAPDESDALLAAGEIALTKGKVEEARSHFARGQELHPKDGRIYEALARVETEGKKPEQAEAMLRRGVEEMADPEMRRKLLWHLAQLLIQEGKYTDTPELFKRMRKEGFRQELLKYLDAQILVATGDWHKARKSLEEVLPFLLQRPDLTYQADLMLARCYERLGDTDQRYAAYRRANALEPLGVPGR